LESWIQKSRHEWTLLKLPAYKWKWRMRHAAVTFSAAANRLIQERKSWEVLFCSDMLNLAEFLGLTNPRARQIPSIAYFHENQLTYPVRHQSERDYQFAMTNMTTALSATEVWFNSAFHSESFLSALSEFLKRMPDNQPLDAVDQIRAKSSVWPQGIERFPGRGRRKPGPARILWVARWEFDKNPELFFQALEVIERNKIDFRISVIGEQFRDGHAIFHQAYEKFRDRIDHWGYMESRDEYKAVLCEADIAVSTANHEFFGVSIAEAIAAGAYPLLPKRLAYPEMLDFEKLDDADDFFYDGSVDMLADKIAGVAERVNKGDTLHKDVKPAMDKVERFSWENLCPRLDNALENLSRDTSSG